MAAVTQLFFLLVALIYNIQADQIINVMDPGDDYYFQPPKENNFCLISKFVGEDKFVLWNTSDPSTENSRVPEDLKQRLQVHTKWNNKTSYRINNLIHSDSGLYQEECWTEDKVTHETNFSIVVCGKMNVGKRFDTSYGGTLEIPCDGAAENLTVQWLQRDQISWRRVFKDNTTSLVNSLQETIQKVENTSTLRLSNIRNYNEYKCLVMNQQQCVSSQHVLLIMRPEKIIHSVEETAALQCPDDITDQPPDDITDQPPDDITDQPPDDITDQPPDDITDQPPDVITDQPPDDITDQPPDDITDQPPNVITDQPPDDITDQPPDDITDQPPDVITDQPPDDITDQPPDVITDQPPNVITDQPPDDITDQPPDDITDQPPVWTKYDGYDWMNFDQMKNIFSPKNQYVDQNNSLVFSSLMLNHTGLYGCVGDYILKQYYLLVCPTYDPPAVELFSEGDEVTLRCNISWGESENPEWFIKSNQTEGKFVSMFEMKHLTSRFNISDSNMSLIISNVSVEDTGEYWCVDADWYNQCVSGSKTVVKFREPVVVSSPVHVVKSSLFIVLLVMLCVAVLAVILKTRRGEQPPADTVVEYVNVPVQESSL